MSGCMKTSSDRHEREPERLQHGRRGSLIRRARSARKPASASTKSSLPNSDGWNWKKPMSIQRFEPRVASASGKTSSISRAVPT